VNHIRITQAAVIAAVGMALGLAALAADSSTKSPLDGAKLKEQIHGPIITADDMKGKVVFFEYWGIRCPPCRKSFGHLVRMQKKYAPSGRFIVIASHVQLGKGQASKFCAEKGVSFPVFQQLRLKHAPCTQGIPCAYIFNHKGRIVAKGHPSKLYSQVPELLKVTPLPCSPLLGKVKLKHFRHMARLLVPGKPIKAAMGELGKKAQGKGAVAAEAQAIIDSVKLWMSDELERLDNLGKTRPTSAVRGFEVLIKTLSGLPDSDDAEELLKRIKADKNVMALVLISKAITKFWKVKERRGATKGVQKSAARLKKRLRSFLNTEDLSEPLTREAEALLHTL
jgi:thiol-disulfide isomerase/thioredoxin